MVFGQLVMPVQCLGSDDMMSLGIKSFATEGVHDKVLDRVHDWYQDLGTRILAPRSWYQDLGIKILVPRSWYRDPGTKTKHPELRGP